jgi:hypothetical protein
LVELVQQANQDQEILVPEESTTSGDAYKRIDRADIGPRGWKRVQAAIR